MSARDDILTLGKRIGQSIIGQEAMVERLRPSIHALFQLKPI